MIYIITFFDEKNEKIVKIEEELKNTNKIVNDNSARVEDFMAKNQEIEKSDKILKSLQTDVENLKSLQDEVKKFKNLRIITTRSTGYNHIDLKYCTQNNIAVFNVGKYGESSVAQFTFMLILALLRKLIPSYLDVQKGLISHPLYEGRNLENLSIGIIGCGSIGSSVAKIANFFGMKVYICSPGKNNDIAGFGQYCEFKELIKKSVRMLLFKISIFAF